MTPLTQREIETLGLLSHGYGYREIAVELGLSMDTVQRTIAPKAMAKLGARTRTEAVAEAIRRGLLPGADELVGFELRLERIAAMVAKLAGDLSTLRRTMDAA